MNRHTAENTAVLLMMARKEEWFDSLLATAQGDLAEAIDSIGTRFWDNETGRLRDLTIESDARKLLEIFTKMQEIESRQTFEKIVSDITSLAECIQDDKGEGKVTLLTTRKVVRVSELTNLIDAIYALEYAITEYEKHELSKQ